MNFVCNSDHLIQRIKSHRYEMATSVRLGGCSVHSVLVVLIHSLSQSVSYSVRQRGFRVTGGWTDGRKGRQSVNLGSLNTEPETEGIKLNYLILQ